MEYILTKDEYLEMKEAEQLAHNKNKELIQRLCMEVCNHKPIKFWGRDEATPWRCWRKDSEVETASGYCDECPVQEDCPEPYKQWSK